MIKNKIIELMVVLSIALFLGSYSEGSDRDATLTEITIDGEAEDWVGRAVLHNDPAGDAETGFLDLTTGYAFINQNALYFLVKTVDASAPLVQFDIFIQTGTRELLISWRPGQPQGSLADITTEFEFIGSTTNSTFAFGPALEARVDLRDLGPPETLDLSEIYIMVGECCEYPAWRAADEWQPARSTPVVNEIDAQLPSRRQRTERPVHFLMADGDSEADYLYRAFIQTPFGGAWGPDGYFYIADVLGRHVVRVAPEGTMDDVGIWRNPDMWEDNGPSDLAFDSAGNLYVSDVRHIYAVAVDGSVETLPYIGGTIGGITFNPDDELYYTDMAEGRVFKVGADGRPQVIARGIKNALDLVFGDDGVIYVSQSGLNRVARVDVATGAVNEFFSDPMLDRGYLAIDSDGDLWVRGGNTLYQLAPDGTLKPFRVDGRSYSGWAMELDIQMPGAIAFDDKGRLWIASFNSSIQYLEPPMPGRELQGMSRTVVAPGFAPGFTAADLEISRDGNLYVYNNNTSPGELWQVSPEGEIEVLLHLEERGNIGMALDDQERLYLGLPNGEISWLDANRNLIHYAWLRSWHMAFAADGYLYAAVGDINQPKSIVCITGVDNYRTLISQIDGKRLGPGGVHVAAAPNEGLYVYDESHRRVYYVDFDGQTRLVADVPGIGAPAPMAASPQGDIFVVPHDAPDPYCYSLLRIGPDGKIEIYATDVGGDPLGAVVSPDGQWLYISENGAIDKIPITRSR